MGVDPDEQLLREALQREAVRLYPGGEPAPLPELPGAVRLLPTSPTRPAPRRTAAWVPLAAAAAVVAVATGLGVGLSRGREEPTVAAPTAQATSARPATEGKLAATDPTQASAGPATAAGAGARTGAVALYWVGGDPGALGLYREFHAGALGVVPAVENLLAGRPLDPDLVSEWRPATVRGGGVTGPAGDKVVAVDLGASAFSAPRVDAEQARLAVQQLVYTATAGVPGATTLRLTVDGRAGYRAWGRLTLPTLIRRDASALASIRVLAPQEGDVVPRGRVTVAGSGYAFEGTISWELSVVEASGRTRLMREGFVTTRGDGVPGDFRVLLTLPTAGRYRFVAYEADAAGSDRHLHPDSKEFTVR